MSDDSPRSPARSDEQPSVGQPQTSSNEPEGGGPDAAASAPLPPSAVGDGGAESGSPQASAKRRVRLVRRPRKTRRVRLVRRPLKPQPPEGAPIEGVPTEVVAPTPEVAGHLAAAAGHGAGVAGADAGGADGASGAARVEGGSESGSSPGQKQDVGGGGRLLGVRDGARGLVKVVADVGLTALETGEALLPEALKPSLGVSVKALEGQGDALSAPVSALSPEKSARVTTLMGASEGLMSLGWAGWNRVLGAAGGVLFEDNFEGELDPDNPAEGLQRMASAMVTGVTVSLLQRAGVEGGERLTEEAVRRLTEELPVMRLLSGALGKPEEAARVEAVVHDARELAEGAPSRRVELARRVGGEVKRFLEDNLTRELQRVLSHLSFEVRTEITFEPVEMPPKAPGDAPRRRLKPSIKNHLRVKRREE